MTPKLRGARCNIGWLLGEGCFYAMEAYYVCLRIRTEFNSLNILLKKKEVIIVSVVTNLTAAIRASIASACEAVPC
jgi:hypothetical protein